MAKRYKYKPGPNRLLQSAAYKLDPNGTVGLVVVETDHGTLDFAVNHGVAEQLRDELNIFLAGQAPSTSMDG